MITRQRRSPSRRLSRRRTSKLLVLWLAAFAVLAGRMAQVQITSSQRYLDLGRVQRIRSERQLGQRGELFDRTGVALAMSVPAYTVSVNPKNIDPADVGKYRTGLRGLLPLSGPVLASKLAASGSYQVLARNIDQAAMDRVAAARAVHKLDAVSIEDQLQRVYPAGDLGRSLIGKANADGGLSGLEKQLDARLRGVDGDVTAEYDRYGHRVPTGETKVRNQVQRGTGFVLTLDRAFQFAVNRMLGDAVERYHALGGTVVVMDTTTGDILADATMVATPDGVKASSSHDAVVAIYDPGSVNKMITMAGALEDRVVGPQEQLAVADGLQVADHRFTDDQPHPTMAWTMGDILTSSSNVGTIMVAKRMGKERVDSYLRRFGLGQLTGLGFPGESRGIMRDPQHWSGTDIGAVPIGQGLSVTPMQMLAAYGVIATDGRRVVPRLVRAEISPAGVQEEVLPVAGKRVVSVTTARQVRSWLGNVVRSGTGLKAAIQGYTVAGKTGTARKRNTTGYGYKPGAYVASFVGLVPAEQPRLAAIVLLDEPTPIYGGETAAPLFAEVMGEAVKHFKIPPAARPDGKVLTEVAKAPAVPVAAAVVPATTAAVVPATAAAGVPATAGVAGAAQKSGQTLAGSGD